MGKRDEGNRDSKEARMAAKQKKRREDERWMRVGKELGRENRGERGPELET